MAGRSSGAWAVVRWLSNLHSNRFAYRALMLRAALLVGMDSRPGVMLAWCETGRCDYATEG